MQGELTMSLGNVRVKFDGLEEADAGRLVADLESAITADVPGAIATRTRTDTDYQDLGLSLAIAFVAESAVIVAFKLIERYIERKAKEAHLTIDIGDLTPAL